MLCTTPPVILRSCGAAGLGWMAAAIPLAGVWVHAAARVLSALGEVQADRWELEFLSRQLQGGGHADGDAAR